MQTFKTRQDGFKEIKKQLLIRTIPIMLIAVTVGIIISTINSKDKTAEVNALPFIIPLIALTIGFGLYRGVNRQKLLFESYSLTITNNMITREQLNTPVISIYLNDIKEITKNKNGSFTIKGKNPTDLIGVPSQMDHYSELEIALNSIQPVVVKNKDSFLQKYESLAGLLTLALMLCVYTVHNKIIIALTGTALAALLIWSFIKIRTSKNIDNKTRKNFWWVLVVLASIIAMIRRVFL